LFLTNLNKTQTPGYDKIMIKLSMCQFIYF